MYNDVSMCMYVCIRVCMYARKVRVYCAIAQWFEVLCCVVDSDPYQLSCPGSSVGRVLA